MQLNLLSRFATRSSLARTGPPSTVPGAWRDSAISQLDAIAAANEASVVSARRRKAAWAIASVGAALWLASGSLSTPGRDVTLRQSRSPATAALPAPSRLAVHGTVTEVPARTPAVATEALPVPVTVDAIDDAARRPRAAPGAETRRKSAALAQERARADEQAQRQQRARDQEAADHARALQQAQDARERAQAAELVQRQVVLVAQNAQDTRRNVRDACSSSGGLLSQQFCQARECRRAEHQDDAVCLRLHEIEVARLQYSVDH
jgi:hypothetical protein